tara:strand:+ start:9566 stop:9874 length:309 start_codon:yes stop_codon:yes gene_type:complete
MATLKVLCKNGLQIMGEGFSPIKVSSSAPIFIAVEAVFSNWLKNSNPASEYYDMYYSEDAIYTTRGAIIGGIEAIIEYMTETGKTYITTTEFAKIDIEAAFQ